MRRIVSRYLLGACIFGASLLRANSAAFAIQSYDQNQMNSLLSANGSGTMWLGVNSNGSPLVYIPGSGLGTLPGGRAVAINSTGGFNNDVFLMASPDGTVSGWQQMLGSSTNVFAYPSGNVYKGITDASVGFYNYIYVTNFSTGGINVIKDSGHAPDLPGSFIDPNLPSGYGALDIQNINGVLYVTYGTQSGNSVGNGIVSKFDLNGNFIGRLITGGSLDSPWGLAIAPSGLGALAGSLLVANSGNGTIGAYNISTGAFIGLLHDVAGNNLVINGLWGLQTGNGSAMLQNKLFFTTTSPDANGNFIGEIDVATTPVPEPSTCLLAAGALAVLLARKQRRRGTF